MPEKWCADLVADMHMHKVAKKELAKELGCTPEYVSMVINGHRNPPGACDRFKAALSRIISAQSNDTAKT